MLCPSLRCLWGVMGGGGRAECKSYFLLDPCARCEERYMRSPIPCEGVEQKRKTTCPRRKFYGSMFCSTPRLWGFFSTGAEQTLNQLLVSTVPPKQSSLQVDKAALSADKDRVNGKGHSNNEGSWKVSIQEHRTPLVEPEDGEVITGQTSSCFETIKLVFREFFRSVKRKEVWVKAGSWESSPYDVQENIFQRLPLAELAHSKAASKTCKDLSGREAFLRSRESSGEVSFTALNFFIKDEDWQCTGVDLQSGTWQRLPTISCLPRPDASLFKEYSVCGHGGLMCANVSKSPNKEELVVFNPFTGERSELPSLHYPRNPVLLHIVVDSESDYRVIAAGSSSGEDHDLSRRMEVFDSRTWQWTVASNILGPEFGLNEHQVGVCVGGILHFIAFLDDVRKGIVAFDVQKGEWLEDRTCAVPFSLDSNILQLLESDGNVYLFSEQERSGVVEHCIDVVEFDAGSEGRLKNIMSVTKSGERGLLVFPEFTCVPYGEGKLCVFNTITRDGVVYDIENGMQSGVLLPPPESQRGENFFSLNPVSFTLQPNFASKPA